MKRAFGGCLLVLVLAGAVLAGKIYERDLSVDELAANYGGLSV